MTNLLSNVKEILLAPAELSEKQIESLFNIILKNQVDDADIYFQSCRHESWLFEDGLIKEVGYDIDSGVGIRALSGEKTGFAYSDEIVLPALIESAKAVSSISRQGGDHKIQAWKNRAVTPLYQASNPIISLTEDEKILLLKDLNEEARKQDPHVTQVIVNLNGVHETVLVMRSNGEIAADI